MILVNCVNACKAESVSIRCSKYINMSEKSIRICTNCKCFQEFEIVDTKLSELPGSVKSAKSISVSVFLRNLSKKHSFLVDFSQNIDFRQFSYNSYDFVIFGLGVRPQGPFSKALEGSSKVPRRFLEGSSKVFGGPDTIFTKSKEIDQNSIKHTGIISFL